MGLRQIFIKSFKWFYFYVYLVCFLGRDGEGERGGRKEEEKERTHVWTTEDTLKKLVLSSCHEH